MPPNLQIALLACLGTALAESQGDNSHCVSEPSQMAGDGSTFDSDGRGALLIQQTAHQHPIRRHLYRSSASRQTIPKKISSNFSWMELENASSVVNATHPSTILSATNHTSLGNNLSDFSEMGLSNEGSLASKTEPVTESNASLGNNISDFSEMGLSNEATPASETEPGTVSNASLGSNISDFNEMGLSNKASPASETEPVTEPSVVVPMDLGYKTNASSHGNYAYVTMWYFKTDPSNSTPGDTSFVSSETARSSPRSIFNTVEHLRKYGAKYPLLILTNKPGYFGPDLGNNGSFSINNGSVRVLPLEKIDWPCGHVKWANTFQKLQIFNLIEYDKLLWLDADVEVKANLDYIFDYDLDDGRKIYAQGDFWRCDDEPFSPLCSGVMLLKPDRYLLSWCWEFMHEAQDHWCPPGDQHMIGNYFKKRNFKIEFLSNRTVVFGQCLKTSPAAHIVHWAR